MMLSVVRVILMLVMVETALCLRKETDNTTEAGPRRNQARTPKFFPFYQVVRFRNDQCVGANFLNGTCFTAKQCRQLSGLPSGTCAKGFGVCCIIIRTCGSSSKVNNTYVTNPSYPLQYLGGINRCDVTIQKYDNSICQLRLDFLDFSLSQPDGDGICVDDVFTISGADATFPKICGENANQHAYVNFLPGDSSVLLSVDTTVAQTAGRKWNLLVTQIACNSFSRAPTGCLMFYTARAGTVKTFNYAATTNPNIDLTSGLRGTREMANLNFGVCVQPVPGYCSIQWSQTANDSFAVSGDSGAVNAASFLGAISGVNCTEDFIVIPNPSQTGTLLDPVDRFCGNALPPTTTSSKPFVLTVVTDGSEHLETPPSDIENRGFSLNYNQIPCG